ncbi:S8 family serine peptidase [Acaryochloris sp. 'Moss Beach']|uniref:S8 family serine peptidase n=1 Tax=Acaryochloris sp. 'Moss Beach' TaxID=2740837 RepID=UPI0028F3FB0B|nr:S8 family serine peptidase [Acaryochloris sp. 'Moss Beach']
MQTIASNVDNNGLAKQHGTQVASIIFGQNGSSVQGIAPNCRGLIIPIFSDGTDGKLASCSQIDLARAITQAIEHGANIINISGGQLARSPQPDPLLAKAIQTCAENNILIVAAAGNDGCECLHIPAAVPSVLAVGAMDKQGNPIGFSNWGEAYQEQGILALGEDILGAVPGDETARMSGTSFATPIVSGLIALLLSLQRIRSQKPDPQSIRTAILKTALPCNQHKIDDCRRYLVGTLNIPKVYKFLFSQGESQVSNHYSEQSELVVSNTTEFSNEATKKSTK